MSSRRRRSRSGSRDRRRRKSSRRRKSRSGSTTSVREGDRGRRRRRDRSRSPSTHDSSASLLPFEEVSGRHQLEKAHPPQASGGRRKAREGDWRCRKCSLLNFEYRYICYLCKENKPMPNIIEPEKAPAQRNPMAIIEAWQRELHVAHDETFTPQPSGHPSNVQ